jgi:hypothetical protein
MFNVRFSIYSFYYQSSFLFLFFFEFCAKKAQYISPMVTLTPGLTHLVLCVLVLKEHVRIPLVRELTMVALDLMC